MIEYITNILPKTLSDIIFPNYGHKTQMTSKEHEKHTYNIFKDTFCCENLKKKDFKKMINKCDYKWKSNPQKETDLIRKCNFEIEITDNCIDLIDGKNYIVNQPSGSQEFPDIVLLNYSNNKLKLYYVECKGLVPKFNNNPPKMKKNVLYICRHQLYCGFLLSTPELEKRKDEYIRRYYELVNEFKSDELKIVPYKVIERDWVKNKGPKCFREREGQNSVLINEYFNHFISEDVKKKYEKIALDNYRKSKNDDNLEFKDLYNSSLGINWLYSQKEE